MSEEKRYRIGDLAKLTDTTPRTIRYYEEIGLLPSAEEREPGAHRVFSEDDLERLREVLRLRELLGVSLEELRDLVAAESARRREVLEQSLGHIDGQLELLRNRRQEIEKLTEELVARRRRVRDRLRSLKGRGVSRAG
jgi:MerR family transcriptional regulator, repressor of the yfmOP operon